MKKFLIIFLIILFLVSCGEKKKSTLITGNVKNYTANTISIGDSLLQFTETGDFFFQTKLTDPQKFSLKYQNNQLKVFVEPGEKLKISFDAKNIDQSIAFEGKSAETNRYLLQVEKFYENLGSYFPTYSKKWRSLCSKDEENFIGELDSLKLSFNENLRKLNINKNRINEEVLFQKDKGIEFTFDWMILQYPHFHKDFTGEKVSFSQKTKDYLETINLDNPDLLKVEEYSDFGDALLHMKIRNEFLQNKDLNKSDNRWLQASLNVTERMFKNQKVKDFWRYQYLNKHIENNGVKHIESFIETFNQSCKSDDLKQKINSLYKSEIVKRNDHPIFTYKRVNGFNLDAHVFIPKDIKEGEIRPAIVYFHGGSWSEGKPDWQFGYSKQGFISVCIEYRTYDRYGALPFEQISDAKSAIRWMRENAKKLHIDPNKIIASGNSAGGHLALCNAMLDTLDEASEDQSISSKPNALILASAVYDVTKGTWFDDLVNERKLKIISPLQHITNGLPPMLIFHGTLDTYSSPYKYCKEFVEKMKNAGNKVSFYPIKDRGHFLWRYGDYWQVAVKAENDFYKYLGYLN